MKHNTGEVVSVDQPLEHPRGGVPLLARRIEVRADDLVDERLEGIELWSGKSSNL